jgi:hypothetical protein
MQVIIAELKSAQLFISILQDEIKSRASISKREHNLRGDKGVVLDSLQDRDSIVGAPSGVLQTRMDHSNTTKSKSSQASKEISRTSSGNTDSQEVEIKIHGPIPVIVNPSAWRDERCSPSGNITCRGGTSTARSMQALTHSTIS